MKSSVNMEKKHVRKFDVRNHVTTMTHKCHGKRLFLVLPAKETYTRQKKKLVTAKRKNLAAKENNLRQKEKDRGKRKIVAAKESNSQKKTKNRAKGHDENITRNKILRKQKKNIFYKFL